MSIAARAVVVASLVTSIAGCAPTMSTHADANVELACDAAQMDRVDKEARRTFKEVHWLRCPSAPASRM